MAQPLRYDYIGRYAKLSDARQFSFFDPVDAGSTIAKEDSAAGLALIGYRASKLLEGLGSFDVECLAQSIDAAINDYFHNEIGIWLCQHGNTHEDSIPTADMDCPTPENTSNLEALAACVDQYSDKEFQPDQQYRLFATLSLIYLDQAIYWQRRLVPLGTSPDGKIDYLVVNELLKATESLCFAENIRIYNWKVSKTPTLPELLASNDSKRIFRKEIEQNTKKEVSRINAENGRKGAETAHARMKELKEFTIQLYKERSWISIPVAANALKSTVQEKAEQLLGRKLIESNATRTIREWLKSQSTK